MASKKPPKRKLTRKPGFKPLGPTARMGKKRINKEEAEAVFVEAYMKTGGNTTKASHVMRGDGDRTDLTKGQNDIALAHGRRMLKRPLVREALRDGMARAGITEAGVMELLNDHMQQVEERSVSIKAIEIALKIWGDLGRQIDITHHHEVELTVSDKLAELPEWISVLWAKEAIMGPLFEKALAGNLSFSDYAGYVDSLVKMNGIELPSKLQANRTELSTRKQAELIAQRAQFLKMNEIPLDRVNPKKYIDVEYKVKEKEDENE